MIDFSRYMRGILATGPDTVRVQPGLVHARLNAQLRPQGRQFGPDPSMSNVTTMGSVIAIDAGGSHWLKYGSARRHVRQLQIVLADGSVLEVGQEPLTAENLDPQTRKGQLLAPLAALVRNESKTIQQHQPRSLVNRCGYQLGDVLANDSLDMARLISGSEGTLALVTEATLATQPLPKHRAVGLLFFDRLESAARAVIDILSFNPSACDLMDRRHLSLARENVERYVQLIPAETEAALLVEHEGDRASEVRDKLAQTIDRIRRRKRLAFHAVQAQDKSEIELYWRLAQKVVPTLYRLKGSTRPLPCVEDVAVPPAALPDFLVRMQNVLKQHQVTASLFAHAGHGQLHLRPFLDLTDPADVTRMAQLAASLYQEVIAVGGTISGEHAAGLSRTPFIRQQYGPLVDVFREVKRIFDPGDLLNPGKIFNDDPELLTRNLRAAPAAGKAVENGALAGGTAAVMATAGIATGGTAATAVADGLPGSAPSANDGAHTGLAAHVPVMKLQLTWSQEELSRTRAAAMAAAHAGRNCPRCECARSFASRRRKKVRREPKPT